MKKCVSLFLCFAIIGGILLPFQAEAAELPQADILNIDYTAGKTVDANGHINTPGTEQIATKTGLTNGAQAACFSAANNIGSHFAVSSDDYNKIKTGFTMEAYFYLTDGAALQDVFSNQENAGVGIEVKNGNCIAYAKYSGNSDYTTISYAMRHVGCWIHAVITYDGSTMVFYINGEKWAQHTNLPGSLAIPDTTGFFVGADTNDTNDSVNPLSAGSMVNRANLYSTALTAQQVAALYQALPKDNGTLFLEAGEPTADAVTFGVISDVHITSNDKQIENSRFKTVLHYFAEKDAAAAFVAGDLTDNGRKNEMANYAKDISLANIGSMQVHECMGNHDRRGNREDFIAYTGNMENSHYKINGYHFILVSPDDSTTTGTFNRSIEWLKKQLELAAADTGDKPIFVFAHHPVEDTVYVSDEWYGNLSRDVFMPYPQVVFFAGHSHAPNNDPLSIWQDGFTAVNTVTLSYFGFDSGYDNYLTPTGYSDAAQGLLVTVDGTEVTIKNHDFIADRDLEDQTWAFDTSAFDSKDLTTFPYNSAAQRAAAKAPVFPAGAEIKINESSPPVLDFSFPQAIIPAEDTRDIVHSYRFEVSTADGKVVTNAQELSDYFCTQISPTLTKTIAGLETDTDYILKVYPCNAYGMEGVPLSQAFSSGSYVTPKADILDVDFNSSYGIQDANGHTLKTFGAPTVHYHDNLSRETVQFDGNDDSYFYRLTEADYQKFIRHFTYELYFNPGSFDTENDIFSGTESAGIGLSKAEHGVRLWTHFNGSYTKTVVDIAENTWCHLMATYDGAQLKIYINGDLKKSVAQSGILSIPTSEARYLVIGGDTNKTGTLESPAACEVALARLYSGCMNASDIQARYQTLSASEEDDDDEPTGGCYVATAVYGSYDCPQVWTLRRFRDETLAKTWYGRAFIRTYYAISPTLVKWFGDTDWFKNMWRKPLDKMVAGLNAKGVADTPYQDLTW